MPTVVAAAALAASLSASALAAWSVQGSGHAAAAATTMPVGKTPTARASGSDVTVTWAAATFPSGTPVGGYDIRRYNAATGAPATVGANCSGTVTATTCIEHNVPAGTWTYTDIPVQESWTGGESPASNQVQVTGGATHANPTRRPSHQPHPAPGLTIPGGSTPTARVDGANVVLTWRAATFPNGTPVAGYVIRRYDAATGQPASPASGCDAIVRDTTCTEHDVPAGRWTYTDTPVQDGRSGSESRGSNPVDLQAPAPLPPPQPSPAPPHEPAMPAGHTPTAQVSGHDVTVTWPAATFQSGTPVAGYVIRRYNAASGVTIVVTLTCREAVITTTCTERDVPAGTWTYTDTPVDKGRTGAESPRSDPVQITVASPAPQPRPPQPARLGH